VEAFGTGMSSQSLDEVAPCERTQSRSNRPRCKAGLHFKLKIRRPVEIGCAMNQRAKLWTQPCRRTRGPWPIREKIRVRE
jgi:hypothetical protein